MSFIRVVTATALAALALFLVACGGGDSENAAEPLPGTAPTLTVPGDSKTPEVDNSTTETTTTETSSSTATSTAPAQSPTTQSNPSTPAGGAAPPATGGASPDSPQNDTSPPDNTPASKFEQFCKENPGAC